VVEEGRRGVAFCVQKLADNSDMTSSEHAALLVASGVVRVEAGDGKTLDAGPGNLIPLRPGLRVKPLYGPAAVILVKGCAPSQPLTRGFGVKCRGTRVYDLTEEAEARIPGGTLIVALRRTIVKSGGAEYVLEPGEIHECREDCIAASQGRLHIVVIEPAACRTPHP